MSIVEDVRKLLQDFLAPEVRSIHAAIAALDKVSEVRHQALLARFDTVDGKIERVDRRFDEQTRNFDMDNRIAMLEQTIPQPGSITKVRTRGSKVAAAAAESEGEKS